ncbi:MAG TPA: hypothetical protein QGI59_03245 [Candidatus Poseidoniia archaeon]|nr:hypothetical protein [Candidatus Poseidoniia archaeon]
MFVSLQKKTSEFGSEINSAICSTFNFDRSFASSIVNLPPIIDRNNLAKSPEPGSFR